jgi:hypothetical protein
VICAPAHAHAALQRRVLLVCTLKQRFNGVRFSGVRYSRSCACSSSAHARAARASAYAHTARMLTQRTRSRKRTLTQRSSGARYLRSWTRSRRSDRAPPLTGSHDLSLLSISLTTRHLSTLHLTRSAWRAPSTILRREPTCASTGSCRRKRVSGVVWCGVVWCGVV